MNPDIVIAVLFGVAIGIAAALFVVAFCFIGPVLRQARETQALHAEARAEAQFWKQVAQMNGQAAAQLIARIQKMQKPDDDDPSESWKRG